MLEAASPHGRLGDRSLFPDLTYRAYVNHAGISPPSLSVRRAMAATLDDYARRGGDAFVDAIAQRQRLKGKLGRLIGARAEDLGLVLNTTSGVIDVALCFPWKAGDRIVLFTGEFPSNVTPWQRAASMFGLEIVWLPLAAYRDAPDEALAALERELARGVRLVAVSAVEFQTGHRMPLAAMSSLCHARGAELFVDGVQACGAVPIDVVAEDIDYLACGSHKWLMGTEGAGFLYVSPERVGALRPNVAGWLSHEEPVTFLLEGPGKLRYDRPIRVRADFVECGNVNAVGCAGLDASVDILLDLGVANIFAHANRYLDALEEGLVARGFQSMRSKRPEARSCILAVLPPAGRSVVELQRGLRERSVACAMPDGFLRFSPHWPNDLAEVPAVLAAVDASLEALPS